MKKLLANYPEISEQRWTSFMDELNDVARRGGLAEYKTYSRVWEYPWLWFQLENSARSLQVLDIGSERSAYPWLLVEKGFDVMVSDVTSSLLGTVAERTTQLGREASFENSRHAGFGAAYCAASTCTRASPSWSMCRIRRRLSKKRRGCCVPVDYS